MHFLEKTSSFVTGTHNFSTLFEKKNLIKIIWIKIKGTSNQKGLERVKSIFWLWFESYVTISIWLLQYRWQFINFVSMIFLICDFRNT